MKRRGRRSTGVQWISRALQLSVNTQKVLHCVALARATLSVNDIAFRLRMSERSVRRHLLTLQRYGLLTRQVILTANQRLAYAYSVISINKAVAIARKGLEAQFLRIDRQVQSLLKARPSTV